MTLASSGGFIEAEERTRVFFRLFTTNVRFIAQPLFSLLSSPCPFLPRLALIPYSVTFVSLQILAAELDTPSTPLTSPYR